jgi:hypothetical protein
MKHLYNILHLLEEHDRSSHESVALAFIIFELKIVLEFTSGEYDVEVVIHIYTYIYRVRYLIQSFFVHKLFKISLLTSY